MDFNFLGDWTEAGGYGPTGLDFKKLKIKSHINKDVGF